MDILIYGSLTFFSGYFLGRIVGPYSAPDKEYVVVVKESPPTVETQSTNPQPHPPPGSPPRERIYPDLVDFN